MKLQRLGGYASILTVVLLVIEIGLAALIASRLGLPMFSNTAVDPLKIMAAYESTPFTFHVLQIFPALMAIALVLVALSLQERMQAKSPNIMRLAVIAASVAFALFLLHTLNSVAGMQSIASSKDVSAYRAVNSIQNGLLAAVVASWGLALLLIGCAAIKTRALPRILGYLCLICGILGAILVFMPQVQNMGALVSLLIGLSLNIIGAVWLGIVLIQKPEPLPVQP
jgi:hypothetical protein